MVAQKAECYFDALEIDEIAARQADENIKGSNWNSKIRVIHQSLQQFVPEKKYDFIFSNPPFFEGDLKSAADQKNNAKHDTALTLNYTIEFISIYLKPGGKASLIIPYHRSGYFEKLLHQFFFIEHKVLVRQTPRHDFFRAMYIFSNKKNQQKAVEKQISIRNQEGEYDAVFIDLLKDYYLNL
jgi:tRNA1Val (adenine37-N6)-methyltransferase